MATKMPISDVSPISNEMAVTGSFLYIIAGAKIAFISHSVKTGRWQPVKTSAFRFCRFHSSAGF